MVEPLIILRQYALDGKAAESYYLECLCNRCQTSLQGEWRADGSNKFAHYKRIWRIWKAHYRSVSGWGRNREGVPVNEFDVEDNYSGDHPDRAIFRDTLPPYHDQLVDIVGRW